MMNPITEMKTEITTAKVLQRDIKLALQEKKQSIHNFYIAKEKAEIKQPETKPTEEIKPYLEPYRSIIADKEKEQQLLQMAKNHYESYLDVARFAEALNLRPGIVYLTLKHHNFIQQNETTQYRVLDAYYKQNGNLRGITEETGLSVWIVSKTLEQLGLSPNWASYKERAETGNLGDWAEEEFKRLVPEAVDMNMQYQMNNPRFDFVVGDKEIDVKYSSKRKTRGNNYQYVIRYNPDNLPDFFCIFISPELADSTTESPKNYHILLIPKSILPHNKNQLTINANKENKKALSSMYWDFEIEPAALSAFLGSI